MGKVVLFLSPHLDDAALSCPVCMQRLVAEGARVKIATVFTARYELRRAEDLRAAAILGAEVLHLDFLDAPFRSPEYTSFTGIGFGRAAEYDATRDLLASRIAELAADEVIAPMAVGNHVDHRLVRDAALTAVEPARLRFYEDRPYAFIQEQVDHVLGHSLASLPEDFWDRYFDTAYVRSYLGDASRAEVRRAWAHVPPFPAALKEHQRLHPTPAEADRAVAAIACYVTQTGDLFADSVEMTTLYGGTPEIQYQLTPVFALD